MTDKFEIIDASAGSGKTFLLASNVIIKILTGHEDSYKKVLALTFTNNSANEMKKRILDELKQISIEPSKSLVFQTSVLSELFTTSSIKGKAKRILNKILHNFSFFPTLDKKVCRSAGVSAQVISKDSKFCRIRLASGEHRLFPLDVIATLGIVSNPAHKLISLGKAGRSRWLNRRPVVRGVAMNPIDHPHGGGEGKTSGGRPSVTPWGKPTKGQPTRKRRSTLHIVKKRKNG